MPLATDAQKAALLAKHLYDPERRDSALAKLREMYPDWGFVWRENYGLSIFLPFGEHYVPRALAYVAAHIQQHVEGGAVILKDRDGSVELSQASLVFPRTCYERLLEDDDF